MTEIIVYPDVDMKVSNIPIWQIIILEEFLKFIKVDEWVIQKLKLMPFLFTKNMKSEDKVTNDC